MIRLVLSVFLLAVGLAASASAAETWSCKCQREVGCDKGNCEGSEARCPAWKFSFSEDSLLTSVCTYSSCVEGVLRKLKSDPSSIYLFGRLRSTVGSGAESAISIKLDKKTSSGLLHAFGFHVLMACEKK